MQIGVITENQFAGDELLILQKEVLPYSYVTMSWVVAYEIDENDLRNLPKEFVGAIEQICLHKLKFVEQWIFNIVKSIDEVAKWDGDLHDKF